MTLLATKLPPAAVPERIVAAWNAFAARSSPPAVVVAASLALTVPGIVFHPNAADDGAVVSIAGLAIGGPGGTFGPIIARLPAALAVLFAALLIYRLLRQLSASAPAALFGVALLLACPLVIRAQASVSAELPLAALLFFAFCLWWDGHENESISVVRWLVTAGVLVLAFLLEGPRPTSPTFFSAGAGGAFARILGDALPAVLGAAAYLLARGYDADDASDARPGGFMAATACYAVASAVFVLLWPGGMGRYYVPAVLALCVLGGLGYDRLRTRFPTLVAPFLLLTGGLLIYGLLYAFGAAA
jgi:Dolichyl-phosphate-mannose-protein mannosyltransferase